MNRDQERRHLAEAERHIAQAQKRVARQRQIVEAAMDRGRPSDEGELLLQIFESNLRTLEGHRRLIVERLEAKDSRGRRPSRDHHARAKCRRLAGKPRSDPLTLKYRRRR